MKKHIQNLEKLFKNLVEQKNDIEIRSDWEAKEGSIGAAENLRDEARELGNCLESLEIAIERLKIGEA